MTIEEDKAITAAAQQGIKLPPPPRKQVIPKKMGRPVGSNKAFVTQLPAPPKHETFNANEFFTYLRSIPEDKLNRVMLSFYRYLPACDITEGGTKDKCIQKIAGESHPFRDEDWEKQILHLFGCGNYGCFLNESDTGTKTVMMCRKIDTRWDPDSYPPVLDPKTLIESFPANGAYVQWLRTKGVQLPSEIDKDKEEMEMQIGETISKLTDTVIAQANRINTPVPQMNFQPSMGEKLTFESAKAAIDMVADQAKVTGHAATQQSNPLDMVNAMVGIAKEMKGGGEDNNAVIKLIMQQNADTSARLAAAEARNTALLDRILTTASTPTKSANESLKETLELMSMLRELSGNGKSDNSEDGESSKPDTIVGTLIKSAPELLQHGIGLWGQLNQSLAYQTRMKELDTFRAANPQQQQGGAGGPMPMHMAPPTGPLNMQQPNGQPTQSQPNGAAPQDAPTQPAVELNPDTNAPYTPVELEARRVEQQQYISYYGIIENMRNPLITHLNNEEKDGYDFAEWFIEGNGRLMYNSVKSVDPDTLFAAMKSYTPLWSAVGSAPEKVREFIGEFLTYDVYMKEQQELETGVTN